MRQKIVAGNWKMNLTLPTATELLHQLIQNIPHTDPAVQVVVAPPFVLIPTATHLLQGSTLAVAAQNCHHHAQGAYTGEVSAPMLQSLGVQYVIIGHSERRQYQAETDTQLAEKTNLALANHLRPIFCVGEPLHIRQANNHFQLVAEQLQNGLFHLSAEHFQQVVVAYEPVWAIGTGITATPQQAQEMHAFIRQLIQKQYGETIARHTPILYGGSCNATNAAELFANTDVDGGLIGGASLKAADFLQIIRSF